MNAHRVKVIACSVAALLALAACAGVSTRVPAPSLQTSTSDERLPVYVIRRGWHVDVGIARADALPPLQPVAAAFPEARYLLFGFGDRRYLLQGGGIGNSLAALWGGAGLVLLTSIGAQQPEEVFGRDNVVRVTLTPQQMSNLQEFIGRTFATRDGAIERVTPGPHAVGSFSGYYESAQHYSALHTCNTWAAQALQAADLPVSSSGVQFAWQLWHQMRHLESAGAAFGFVLGTVLQRLRLRSASAPARVAKRHAKMRVSIDTATTGRLCTSIRRLFGSIASCAAGSCAG